MIRLAIPWVPPSVNNAYETVGKRVGKRVLQVRRLSDVGQRFKNETLAHLVRQYPTELKTVVPGRPYALAILLHLERVENAGWPKTAKSRYKSIDVSNRVKLVEDVLVSVTAVDDDHNFLVAVAKVAGVPERTDLWIWDLLTEPVRLPDEFAAHIFTSTHT